jgi:hypothetical protein
MSGDSKVAISEAFAKIQLAPIPLPTYSGESDSKPFANYINDFNKIAQAVGWKDPMCAQTLPALLRGRAAEAYDSLSKNDKADWKVLIDKLAEKLTVTNPATARRQLNSRKKRDDESFYEFAQAIKHLSRVAFQTSAGFNHDQIEQLAVETFIHGLDIQLKEQLLRIEMPIKDLNKAVEAAITEENLQNELELERAVNSIAINTLEELENNPNFSNYQLEQDWEDQTCSFDENPNENWHFNPEYLNVEDQEDIDFYDEYENEDY